MLLRNVGWETYERLIAEREESRVPRFYYDRGVLEILSPSKRHETVGEIVALLVELLAVEMDVDVESAGSTTFKREDLDRGFEPDKCFYFSGNNIDLVRGKKDVDLDAGDPAPDLVIEVDITSPSLNKLPIYARLGVREVWRYADGRMEMLELRGENYETIIESGVLPPLTREVLTRLIEEGLTTRRPDWVRKVREWARDARRSDG